MPIPRLFSNPGEDVKVSKLAMEACEHIVAEIGAEIHDDLVQRLSVLHLSLDKLERSLPTCPEVQSAWLVIRRDFLEVIQSTRALSRNLLPSKTDSKVLSNSLAVLCQNMERPGAGNIHFSNIGPPVKLESTVERYLCRIAQELIHNAYKHSAAWHVWVRCSTTEETVSIEVEDDGTGLAKIPEYLVRLKGRYNTLRMRSEAIGASIRYHEGRNGLLAVVHYNFKERN